MQVTNNSLLGPCFFATHGVATSSLEVGLDLNKDIFE